MRTYFLTYSDNNYLKARNFSAWTAKYIGGFNEIIVNGPQNLDSDFIYINKKILSYKRGAGLWLWKPYIISKTLRKIDDGDVLFYSDAGACFVRSAKKMLEFMEQDIWCCDIPTIEEEFTKEVCFLKMKCEEDKYKKTNQRIATFLAIRKSPKTQEFVEEWLFLCQNEELILPEIKYDNKKIISHREDQSIFSLLTKKYNYSSHKIPTTSSLYPKIEYRQGCTFIPTEHYDKYKIFIFLHKKKDLSFLKYVIHFIYVRMPKFVMDIIAKKRNQI